MERNQEDAAQAPKAMFEQDRQRKDHVRQSWFPEGPFGAWHIMLVFVAGVAGLAIYGGLQMRDRHQATDVVHQFCSEEAGHYTRAYQLLSARLLQLVSLSDVVQASQQARLTVYTQTVRTCWIPINGAETQVSVSFYFLGSGGGCT